VFILGKLLAAFLFPPGLFVLCFLALAVLGLPGRGTAALPGAGSGREHRDRLLRRLSLLAALLLYLLSTDLVSGLLIAPLEDSSPPLGRADPATEPAAGDGAGLIVVLGGGSTRGSPEYGGRLALSDSGLRRAAYGAELHRRLGLPLLYTGGAPLEGPGAESEASAAVAFWLAQGIAPGSISLEEESRDTAENASLSAGLAGGWRIILVTSAFHMPRSLLSFRRAGLDPVPAPTDYRRDRGGLGWPDLLPRAGALETTSLALHEYVGLLWYAIRLPAAPGWKAAPPAAPPIAPASPSP
jgi:uncharacterized SAM-binding protein YcdF (DUF218 family)